MEQHKVIVPYNLKGQSVYTAEGKIDVTETMSKKDYLIVKEIYPELCIIEKTEIKDIKIKKATK